MKFVAIDSSLANTGIAIGNINKNNIISIDNILLISTEKTKNKQVRASSDTIQRCRKTYSGIHDVLLIEQPDIIFMETPSGSQNSSAMKSYGATCQLIACLNPVPIEVTPTEVKIVFTNDKKASKRTIINKAYKLFPKLGWYFNNKKELQNKNEHMADAIAIAHAGIQTSDYERLQTLVKNIK